MAGAAPQQGQQPPVATDPSKAADGQLFKGGEGAESFDIARANMNEKLRLKQEADAKAVVDADAQKTEQAKIDGEATALVDGIDIDKIANEVDADWKMAEKIRQFRTMTPENQQKLQGIIHNVDARRQARIDELLNDPELNAEIDAALEAPVAGQPPAAAAAAAAVPPAAAAPAVAPAAVPAAAAEAPAAGAPAAPAAQPPAAQEPAAVQNPGEPVVPAVPAQPPAVTPPQPQLDNQALLDSKLDAIRTEMNDKFQKQEDELAQEKIRREEAEKKMQEMQQADEARVQQQVRTTFDENAGKLGIPEDLRDVAFGKARDIVNVAQRQMSWDEIFASMKEQFPSLFREVAATTKAPADGEQAGGTGETVQKKVTVKPGTGSDAGGKAPTQQPPVAGKKKGHESWDEAKKALSARAGEMMKPTT